MNRKTIRYSILLSVLFIANLFLLLGGQSPTEASFDDELFLVADTSQITSVIITKEQTEVRLVRESGTWTLNDRYEADENFRNLLFSIFNRVKVKRTVGTPDHASGGKVTIQLTQGKNLEYTFYSNPNRTRSYFTTAGKAYEVGVPGYHDNVADIFELHPDQWRSRLVFDGSWRTIQVLELDYPGSGDDLTIRFQDSFFQIDGLQAIDSSGVVDYLNQFQFFQANEMISPGRFSELDSLARTPPLALLTIEDIKNPEPYRFSVYPALPGQNYHLVTGNSDKMMVISRSRIQSILGKKSDFQK